MDWTAGASARRRDDKPVNSGDRMRVADQLHGLLTRFSSVLPK